MAEPRSHRRYRQFRAQLLAEAMAAVAAGGTVTCHLCPNPIDPWQPYAGGRNPAAPTLEHITPLINGGALMTRANSALAHRGCQSQQGGRLSAARRSPTRYSREW